MREAYRPHIAAVSYLVGVVAVVAAVVDDGEDDLYTFHVWQALLINVAIGVLAATGAVLVLPWAIRAVPLVSRATAIVTATLGLIVGLLLLLAYPAYRAYHREELRIPGVAPVADRLVETDAV